MGFFFTELKGGLGNQLFQLAFSLARSVKYSTEFVLFMPKGHRVFSLDFLGLELNRKYRANIIDGELKIWKASWLPVYPFMPKKVEEKGFGFNEFPTSQSRSLFVGYFQSFKYFEEIDHELRKFMLLKLMIDPITDSEIPTIHVRLGDYVSNPITRRIHGYISMDYLVRGLQILNVHFDDSRIVTDDRRNLEKLFPELVDKVGLSRIHCSDQLSDFRMLTSSKRIIISNSTFSWWAAYLSQGHVVAPREWFSAQIDGFDPRDFFPTDWNLT